MLTKTLVFTAILLLPALANAKTTDSIRQPADNKSCKDTDSDLQLELRYYAPKLKFTSQGIVPTRYSNFRDTLNIKNGNAPEYRLSGKNWYLDYIGVHENGNATHHINQLPLNTYTKLNLDYASLNYLAPIKKTENSSSYWLAGLRYYRFDTSLEFSVPVAGFDKKYAKQLNQFAPAFGIGGRTYIDNSQQLALYGELSGLPLGGRGHTYDLDIGLKYKPCKNLSATAGYRVLDLKIKNDDGTGLYKLSGWYGGLNYSF